MSTDLQILNRFFNRVKLRGPYVEQLCVANRFTLGNVLRGFVKEKPHFNVEQLADAMGLFIHNAWLRGIDIAGGDIISLKAVYSITRDNIQRQLNLHHFGFNGEPGDNLVNDNCYSKLEDFFNFRTISQSHEKRLAVINIDGTTYNTFANPEVIVEFFLPYDLNDKYVSEKNYSPHDVEIETILDFRNMFMSLERMALLLRGYSLANVHCDAANKNMAMLILNQCTLSSQKVHTNTKLSPMNRNGIQRIHPKDAVIASSMYENCPNKLFKATEKGCVYDNLRHPLTRVACGLPSGTGVSSFDLVFPPMTE